MLIPERLCPFCPLMPQPSIETFRARTMIVNSLGHMLPKTVHDHETARRGARSQLNRHLDSPDEGPDVTRGTGRRWRFRFSGGRPGDGQGVEDPNHGQGQIVGRVLVPGQLM